MGERANHILGHLIVHCVDDGGEGGVVQVVPQRVQAYRIALRLDWWVVNWLKYDGYKDHDLKEIAHFTLHVTNERNLCDTVIVMECCE